MAKFESKLTRKQQDAIAALLTQRSIEDAARLAGVGTRTLYRWIADAQFDAAYRQAKRIAFRQAMARLQQGSAPAVSALLKVMVDPGAPAAARVRAASSVLDHAAKAMEWEDLDARIGELERAAKAERSA